MSTIAGTMQQINEIASAIAAAVEELLRYSPPVRALFRAVTKDTELGGTKVPEGATVMMLFASGNDDEQVFACPRTFDADRKNVIRHVAFGGGIHLCAGIALARMEIKTTLREVITRLKDIRLERARAELLAGGDGVSVTTVAMAWGFTHLGKFSNDYRARFGELPSQTLRHARSGR